MVGEGGHCEQTNGKWIFKKDRRETIFPKTKDLGSLNDTVKYRLIELIDTRRMVLLALLCAAGKWAFC